MTLTFNSEKYKEVLSEYQPKLIKTEAENERALAIVEQLMNSPDLSPEQEEIEVMSKRQPLTLEMIRALHHQLNIPADLLLQ